MWIITSKSLPFLLIKADSAEQALKSLAEGMNKETYKTYVSHPSFTIQGIDDSVLSQLLEEKYPDDTEFTIINDASF
jgi:hypothetical protein